MDPEFEWDAEKAKRNRAKHRVTFEEAATVFGDPFARIGDDPTHSEQEDRFLILGESDRRRLLLVSFTERGDKLRIISARLASRQERKKYEELQD